MTLTEALRLIDALKEEGYTLEQIEQILKHIADKS